MEHLLEILCAVISHRQNSATSQKIHQKKIICNNLPWMAMPPLEYSTSPCSKLMKQYRTSVISGQLKR